MFEVRHYEAQESDACPARFWLLIGNLVQRVPPLCHGNPRLFLSLVRILLCFRGKIKTAQQDLGLEMAMRSLS